MPKGKIRTINTHANVTKPNNRRETIKTKKEVSKKPVRKTVAMRSLDGKINNQKKKTEKEEGLVGNIDTYSTTDTGIQMAEVFSPLAKKAGKGSVRVVYTVGKIGIKKLKTIKKTKDLKDELTGKRDPNSGTRRIKTGKGQVKYRNVGSVRFDKTTKINKLQAEEKIKGPTYARTIKTGRYTTQELKTALKKRQIDTQVKTIKAGNYSIKGYRSKKKIIYSQFKHSRAKVNEQDVSNTSYEAIQDGRIKTAKATNILRAGNNTIKAARSASRIIKGIEKEKVDVPIQELAKIKTGGYVDPFQKRTLSNNRSAKTVSNTIHTGQVKVDIALDKRQGRGVSTPKDGIKSFKSMESFKYTSATVQEKDTSNTGIEIVQQGRVINTKIRNGYRGAKNVVNASKNIKAAGHHVKVVGRKIVTKQRSKIRTKPIEKKYATKNIQKKQQVARKSVAAAQDAAIKIGAAIKRMKALVNPIVIKFILIMVVLFTFMNIISSVMTGFLSIGTLTYTYIMTEPEIIIEAKERVEALNKIETEKIEKLLASEEYDDIKLIGPDEIKVGFQDVLAIMGVEDEQTYRLSKLEGIYRDFVSISKTTEEYQEEVFKGTHHHYDDKGNHLTSECHDEYETVDRIRLIINVYQYNFIQIMDTRGFDEEQQNWGMNLAGCNLLDMYPELAEAGITVPQGSLTDQEINDILSKLPTTGATRENIVAIAESLVGKIAYGWGSKADPPTVPSKLDCSGFTDYVFKLAGAGTIGAGTYGQWDNSYAISASEIKIGDLGFLKPPSQSSDSSPNHVGIFAGYDSNGNMMFVHCQGGTGTVKTTAQAAGLQYFRRPLVNFAK